MSNKKTLRTVATVVVAANVLASTFITAVPGMAFAAENAAQGTNVGTQAETKLLGGLQSTDNNLLVNSGFNGFTGWVDDTSVLYAPSSWSSATPNGDGSIDLYGRYSNSSYRGFSRIYQNVPVKKGHTYRLTSTVTNMGGDALFGIWLSNKTDNLFGDKWVDNIGTEVPLDGVSSYLRTLSGSQTTSYDYTVTTDNPTLSVALNVEGRNTTGGTYRFSNISLVDVTFATTTLEPISTNSTTATGKGQPGGTAVIKNGDTVIGTGTVDTSGNYSIAIPKQSYDSTITATVTTAENGGNTSSASQKVTQAPIATPTINPLTTKSTTASGTGEPGATLTFTANGVDYTATVAADGTWSVAIPTQAANALVEATSVLNGVASTKATATVQYTGPSVPLVGTVTNLSTAITGTADPGNTITIRLRDGSSTIIYTGQADATFGRFSIPIEKANAGATVEVFAKDSDNTTSDAAMKTVIDVIAPDAPTVQGLTDTSTQVIGNGEPNCTVSVTLPSGGTIAGVTDADGKFSITIPKQAVGKDVSVALTDAAGNKGVATVVTVQADILANPTVNRVSNQDTKVTGTGVAGATVTVTADGKNYTGIVDASGNYEVAVPKLAAGLEVAVQQAKDNKTSGIVKTIVQDDRTPSAPTVNPVKDTDTTITGKGTAGDTITVKIGDNTYTGSVSPDGTFSIVIPKQAGGTVIDVTETNPANGNTSTKAEVTVSATKLPAPTIKDYYVNDGYVSGTAPAGAKKVTVEVAGKTIRSVDVAENGTYKVYVNDNAAMGIKGTEFQVYALDANGNAGNKATSTVKEKIVAIAPPTINDYVVNSGYVTGKATAPATKVTISVGGKDLRTGDVAADGTFKIYVNDNADMKIVGTDFTAVAKDAAGNVSKPTTSKVKGTTLAKPTIDAYYAGQEYVTGTTDKVTSKIGLYDKAGNLLRYGAVDAATGTYKIYASDKASMRVVGDQFSVKAIDTAGTATAPTTSTILTALLGKPTIDDYHKGDEYVTGKTDLATFKIGLYDNNGTLLRTGLVNPDGTYKIYGLDKAFMQVIGDNFTVRAINAANVPGLAANSTVLGERVASKVTAKDYNLGDNNVTGTYTGAGAKVQLFVNDVLVKNGAIDTTNGTYQIFAKDYVKATTDKVEVVLYDKNWQELDRTDVNVKTAVGPALVVAPAVYTVGDPNVTGTLDGVSKGVRLYVNGVLARVGQVSEDGKTFAVYAQDKITSADDVVTIVGIDKDNKEVTAAVTVKASTEAPDALKIGETSYTLNTDNLTGSYTGTMNGVELWVNGAKVRTGGFEATAKTFTVYAKDKITSASDVVQIKGYDKNWKLVTIDVTVN
ncbi:hypothetical protein HCB27_14415 [Listeria booriae]|uniref:Bacterial Ig domain-containing protein n=1 Tax=Listeria booriae TaxID=1552123 RepID=A0A7X1D9J0_9LIST|nr:Ig-like domain-containing protein [Listeria booriae]MBC2177757.1 hypothetical protein [Listeria booriae]MBC2177822.1 hypothetical protein [Listeria booriae]